MAVARLLLLLVIDFDENLVEVTVGQTRLNRGTRVLVAGLLLEIRFTLLSGCLKVWAPLLSFIAGAGCGVSKRVRPVYEQFSRMDWTRPNQVAVDI